MTGVGRYGGIFKEGLEQSLAHIDEDFPNKAESREPQYWVRKHIIGFWFNRAENLHFNEDGTYSQTAEGGQSAGNCELTVLDELVMDGQPKELRGRAAAGVKPG